MPKHRKTLRIEVIPKWDAPTLEAFTEPALAAIRIRLRREWLDSMRKQRRGRPSIAPAVHATCRRVWLDWGRTFGDRSLSEFMDEVRGRLEKQDECTHDAGRIAKHVRDWMRLDLYYEEYPESYLRSRHGKGIAELIRQRERIVRILDSGSQKEKEAIVQNLQALSSPPSLAQSINLRPRTHKKTVVRSRRSRK